jgi:hypothetical protein
MSRGFAKTASVIIIATPILWVCSFALWIGYAHLKGHSSNPLTYAFCVTDIQAKFENVEGWDFEAEDCSCDTLAKDEEVRVFAVPAQARNSRLASLLARRRLIFAYGPWTTGVDGLKVQTRDGGGILISLPQASQVFEKDRTLDELTIDYDIHRVEYP